MDKVTLFEGSESGAAAVKYKGAEAPEAAQRCVAMMSGRSFGGSLIKAELYDGVSDYRAKAVREASAGGGGGTGESTEEQEEKLESFAQACVSLLTPIGRTRVSNPRLTHPSLPHASHAKP